MPVTTKTRPQKKSYNKLFIIIGLVILTGAFVVQSSPSRQDVKTENDLEYMRQAIGTYVTNHQTMPTEDQLNISSSLKRRLAAKHYSLALVADHSSRSTFLQEPTFDYKQCADFLTDTTSTPGNTANTKAGFSQHHKGNYCFIDYAALKKNVFKPNP